MPPKPNPQPDIEPVEPDHQPDVEDHPTFVALAGHRFPEGSPERAAHVKPNEMVDARYVGVDAVMAVVDGVQVILAPGDRIRVTAEQLDHNPDFQPWED